MATEVPVESKVSVLDELMNDEETTEETPVPETDEEEVIPDHEVITPDEDEDDKDENELPEKEKSEEEDEEKLDLEDKEEDELELAQIPKWREIKESYPGIDKKFPQLQHVFFRERAFAEVFPTVNDAKEAKQSIEEYNGFQQELLSGNIDGVLKSVKATDPKAFDKIAAGIIDSLVRTDPNSHLPTTRKITKGVLYQINQLAKMNLKKDPNNKNAQQLEIASELIHDAIFNTSEVNLDQEQQIEKPDPEREKFKQEREQFEKTRMTTAIRTVTDRTNKVLVKAVTDGIDTKNILPEKLKDYVVQDVMKELDRQLSSDKAFASLVDKLWMKAAQDGYSDASLANIQTALKNKAKSILPVIMKAKKGEALKGLSTSPQKKEIKRELSRSTQTDRTGPKERLTLNRKESDRLERRPGESIRDFLMRD